MFDEIAFFFLGIVFGLFTGVIPGIHPNTVIFFLISYLPIAMSFTTVENIVTFIVALSVTHTFTSFISATVLGVPEEENALSVYPAHKLSLRGEAYKAIYLTVLGGISSTIFIAPVVLIEGFMRTIADLYRYSLKILPIVLTIVLIYMIIIDRNKFYASLIAFASGVLGYVSLNTYSIEPHVKLLAIFSGLFGASTLVVSIFTSKKLREQNFIGVERYYIFDGFLGFLSAFLVIFFPSLSPSQAVIITQSIFKRNLESFLVSLGGLTTADIILSFISLFYLGNPRSGASVAVEQLEFKDASFCIAIAYFSIPIAGVLTILFSKKLLVIISKLNYRKLNIFTLIFLSAIVSLNGLYPLILFITSTSLGILAQILRVQKNILVSVLIIPTIISFTF